jgi:transcriptional regulator with XRE-family HTH domain
MVFLKKLDIEKFFCYYNSGGERIMDKNERIKTLRKKIKLTQSEFAKKIGVTESAICNYENGKRAISEQTLRSISREFNVNIVWLETGKGDIFLPEPEGVLDELATQYNLNETEIEILKNYLSLSEKEREGFVEILKKIF